MGGRAVPVMTIESEAQAAKLKAARPLKASKRRAVDFLLPMVPSGSTWAASVAEIIELQWNADIRFAQEGDGLLQVVTLLARYSDLVALDLRLDFQLRVLDQARYFPTRVSIDAMLQYHQLLGSGKIDLRILHVEA